MLGFIIHLLEKDLIFKERYIERLEYYYKFKTKQLRIYMPLAIENNANK
jgi:hypothetical protein